MLYPEFRQMVAGYGFTECHVTETGYSELLAIGFTPDDIYSVQCDLAAGFTQEESIAALERAKES